MSKKTRNDVRASMFSEKNTKPAVEPLILFGEKVELHQPTLEQMNKLGRQAADAKIPPLVFMMIEYCYMPDSSDKVFEPADAQQLAQMPTGPWLTDFNKAVGKLTGVDVEAAEKNSEETA